MRVSLSTFIKLSVCSMFFLTVAPLRAQIPDTFKNLKVLDSAITKQQLIGVMRGWSIGLGVRCDFCHVGQKSGSLEGMDFASDDKMTKRNARIMYGMTNDINGKYITKTEAQSDSRVQVECVTCHRGQPEPRQTIDVLWETYSDLGVDSSISKYQELRDKYYGRHTYDFSEQLLPDLASRVSETSIGDALPLLMLNEELYPDSPTTYFMLGQVYTEMGDTLKAVEAYEKSLELNPDNRRVKRMLDALKGSSE